MDQRPHPRAAVQSTFPADVAPDLADGIEKYLASGRIRGVGPVYAKKLVRAFGRKFDVIEATPDRLRETTASTGAAQHSPPGLNRRRCGKSWSFCTATVSARRGRCGSSDLWFRRHPGHDREPVSAGARYPRHRIQDRRRYCDEARHREDRDDPGSRRDFLCADRGHG